LSILDSDFSEVNLFLVDQVDDFSMKTVSITNVTDLISAETSSTLISINPRTVAKDRVLELDSFIISESNVTLLSLIKNEASTGFYQYFSLTNLEMTNCEFYNSIDYISIGNVQNQEHFSIMMSDVHISNITSLLSGNLLSLKHQTHQPLVIQDSTFDNLANVGIIVESFNQEQNGVDTQVLVQNVTMMNIDSQSNPWMQFYGGANVFINQSELRHISSNTRGSVGLVSGSTSRLELHESSFQNNTSLNGGVFYSEYQGRIQATY